MTSSAHLGIEASDATFANEKALRTTLCLILLAVTVAVYGQVCTFDFINYDDSSFISGNPHSATGLTLDNFKWAFTTLHGGTSYYHPLTWLSYQLDTQVFGLRAGTVHLTNLLLHLANSVLLLLFLHRATSQVWRAAAVAALFALHPLHVETVCWTSERKSLVCAFFWMLTMLAYLRYTRHKSFWSYGLVFLMLVASLMSKPMALTLPFVLLLLDYWPLGRLQRAATGGDASLAASSFSESHLSEMPAANWRSPWRSFLSLVIEKVPFFLVAAGISGLTVLAQKDLGAMAPLEGLPMKFRMSNAAVAYLIYIRKMLWPSDLAPIYPLRTDWSWSQVGSGAMVLIAITMLSFRMRRSYAFFLIGWIWYLGTLVPMIGIVQVGSQGMADRYTYISLIGLFIALIWGAAECLNQVPKATMPLAGAFTVVVACCTVATGLQAACWKNSVRLFSHATRVSDKNFIAEQTLALALGAQGDWSEAQYHFRRSLAMQPSQGRPYARLSDIALRNGDPQRALHDLLYGLSLDAKEPEVHALLASLYLTSVKPGIKNGEKALEHARRACELCSYQKPEFLVLLAHSCLEVGRYREAGRAAQGFLALMVLKGDIREGRKLLREVLEYQRHHEAQLKKGVAKATPTLQKAGLKVLGETNILGSLGIPPILATGAIRSESSVSENGSFTNATRSNGADDPLVNTRQRSQRSGAPDEP